MSTVTDLTKSSIFALLQQGMKDRHSYGIATLISLCPELFDVFEQYAKDKLESEVELEAQEPVGEIIMYAPYGKLCAPFARPEWSDGTLPQVGTKLYAAPQTFSPRVKISKEEVCECFDTATEILALREQVKNQKEALAKSKLALDSCDVNDNQFPLDTQYYDRELVDQALDLINKLPK